MNQNKSHITLVVDRSGSMQRNRDDAEGAVNHFISEQAKLPGDCTLLLFDFDAPHVSLNDTAWFTKFHDGPIEQAPAYILQPRGGTALYDAMGQAITMTGERLAAMDEADRPSKVFFVVQTDGGENSSADWKLSFLIETIKQQETVYDWAFIFLGVGPDAFAQSQQFIGTRMVANTTQSANTGAAYMGTYSTASTNIGRSRGAGGQSVNSQSYGAKVDGDGNVTEQEVN